MNQIQQNIQDNTIHLVDVFHTIQGEGLNCGRSALFIRMPFCNLACPWCDTEFNTYKAWSESEFLKVVKDSQSKGSFAVITGGEPTIHKHTSKVIKILKDHNFEIAMESNGQFDCPAGVDYLTVSPKRWSKKDINSKDNVPFVFNTNNTIGEIKLVVDGNDCFAVADRITEMSSNGLLTFKKTKNLYLSPEWNNKESFMPQIIDYVINNPMWKISIQSHKVIGAK